MAEVYAICFPNGKLYVGWTSKTAEQRFRRHVCTAKRGTSYVVYKALRKYGPENIRLAILARGVSWAEAKELEVYWIDPAGDDESGEWIQHDSGWGRFDKFQVYERTTEASF